MNKIKVYTLPQLQTINNESCNNKDAILRAISKEVHPRKEEILAYLRSAVIFGAYASVSKDIFTGEPISIEHLLLTDGKFRWTSDIEYYVEKYNLRLQDEFINTALTEKQVHINQNDLY